MRKNMIKSLKKQRTTLIVCLALSMSLHLVYGIEGMKQTQVLEYQIEKQKAQLMDKQEQIKMLEIMLEQQEEVDNNRKHLGEFEITYYCPCTSCCGKTDGITASGTLAQEGITVAGDWDILPLESQIYIEGIGYRTVEDKGGAIVGQSLDVFVNSHAEALELGRHKADVWLIEGR
jgi:3D (Asp-Asp-Asp) domain-containing protein